MIFCGEDLPPIHSHLLCRDVCFLLNEFLYHLKMAVLAGSVKWCYIPVAFPFHRVVVVCCTTAEHLFNNTACIIDNAMGVANKYISRLTQIVQQDMLHEMQCYLPDPILILILFASLFSSTSLLSRKVGCTDGKI